MAQPPPPTGGAARSYSPGRSAASTGYRRPSPSSIRPGPTRTANIPSPYTSALQNFYGSSSRQVTAQSRQGPDKPFAEYRQAPAVSPYMNLFRTDNLQGTVDNYYTLVKPRIDQRNANVRVKGAIRGLQSTTRNLELQSRGYYGQGYHMNYGGYYPGLGR